MRKRSRIITVIGAGNLGANIAYFLSENSIGDSIYVYDTLPGRALGKALDMAESQPIRRSSSAVYGCDSLSILDDSDIVIIAITLDMYMDLKERAVQEEALMNTITELVPAFANYDGVVIFASQLEQRSMLHFVAQTSLNAERIIGLGTVPHSMYVQNALRHAVGVDPSQVEVLIIGNSEHPTIVESATKIAGISLAVLYPQVVVGDVAGSMDFFVHNFSSNYYRYAAATARIAQAIDSDMKRILSVGSIRAMQEYATEYVPAIPAVVSANGADCRTMIDIPLIRECCESQRGKSV